MKVKNEESKRYLVTGGCGFIGSHLVDTLIEQGHEVIILDDLSTGKVENVNPGATFIIGCTVDYDTVESAFHNIDGCFHLAAVASVEKSITDWTNTHKVNVTSAVNIFQAASKQNPPTPVVYTSSAAVYGNCEIIPISENVRIDPLTAYGADKFSCDLHGRVAWNVHKVPNIGMRPFNVYGPRQDPHSPYSGVISIFTNLILSGNEITVYGDGEQVRDFVYVSDAVKAFTAAMKNLEDGSKNSEHQEINLCTGRATSINKLTEIISDIAGCRLRRIHDEPRKGDIRISIGDPTFLESRLNLKLETTLEEGLTNMLYNFATKSKRKAG